MATKVFDDLATRFMSFSDALEQQFGDISIDFSLPSKTLSKGSKPASAGDAAGDAKFLAAAAEEREAARKRGEEILQQLAPGYFDGGFDALKHELCQLGPDAKQDDIDIVVDRLTAAMEVVGVRLARHVLKNQDKLIAGITSVTHVEDDVKAAYVVCQGSRAQLRVAGEEVRRQIKIITSTRKKQHSMEVLDVLSRVKKVKDLPAALRRAHEEGDHAEAILLCVDSFHAVETLSGCKIAPALQMVAQRAYYDAMQSLHAALLNVCADFHGEGYSRLLEAYLLQGVPPDAVGEKVHSCFEELFRDVSTRLIRSMVVAKAFAAQAESPDSPRGSSPGLQLESCTYAELCHKVTPDMLQPCLVKLLEVLYDLLVSYNSMLAWHDAGLAEHTQAAAAAAAAAASAAARSPGHSQDETAAAAAAGGQDAAGPDAAAPSQEQLDHVQAATKGILLGVQSALQGKRMATAEAAAVLVKELLVGARGCVGADFPQVVSCCLRFAALAEAFAGGPLATRDALLHILSAFVRGSHKSNMQELKQALAVETWGEGPRGASGSADAACVQHSLSDAAFVTPGFGQAGFISKFEEWEAAGNPFRRLGRTAGGQSTLDTAGRRVAAASMPGAADGSSSSSTRSSGGGGGAGSGSKVSRSCVLVSQWLADYAGLMTPLPAAQQQLWGGITELFDNYLLACFILFSGVSLQTLVWQDDCLPNRLRTALLRITTSSGCKYKEEVEELQQSKPAPASAEAASAASGAGGSSSTSSKLDMFTRKFKSTMVDLINTDLSQPINEPHGHSPMLLTPRQWQQQPSPQQSRSSTPSTPQPQPDQAAAKLQQQQQPSHQPQRQQPQQQQPSQGSSSTAVQAAAAAGVPVDPAASAAPDNTQHAGAHATFLRQCVSAMDSLGLLAGALKAARQGLLQQLKGAGMTKEVEGYFSRTVDAAADLRDAICLGAAGQLLPGVADVDYGLASAIAECNYNMAEPATRHQLWVAEVVQQYAAFSNSLAVAKLPADTQEKFWEAALRLGADALLDGMGQVRCCSRQGRAAMSLDLSAVEKGLRPLAPPTALSSLRRVDNFIKAFYIPWEEFSRWAQTHLVEYGKARILVLVECMADAYGVKRGQRAALLHSIRAQLTEFA